MIKTSKRIRNKRVDAMMPATSPRESSDDSSFGDPRPLCSGELQTTTVEGMQIALFETTMAAAASVAGLSKYIWTITEPGKAV